MKRVKVIGCFVVIGFLLYGARTHLKPVKVEFASQVVANEHAKTILFVHLVKAYGGAEVAFLRMCQQLAERGHHVSVFLSKGSWLEEQCIRLKIPYYSTGIRCFFEFRPLYKLLLKLQLGDVVAAEKCSIVHCIARHDVFAAKKVSKHYPITICYSHQDETIPSEELICSIDGVVGISPSIIEHFTNRAHRNAKAVQLITYMPPFFDFDSFATFHSTQTRREFFESEFGVKLSDDVVVCMVARMDQDKNQQLLIRALADLIHNRGRALQLVFAGDGVTFEALKALVVELKLEAHVHFLGFTSKIPEVIYFSDINVLPSIREGLGIVLLEAALMKKALISSSGTGTRYVVKHEETGLLFENNNVSKLADALERYLDDPAFAQKMGEQAFRHVSENFNPRAWAQELERFYDRACKAPEVESPASVVV